MTISLALSNKIKMKLGKQSNVLIGIPIFQSYIQ